MTKEKNFGEIELRRFTRTAQATTTQSFKNTHTIPVEVSWIFAPDNDIIRLCYKTFSSKSLQCFVDAALLGSRGIAYALRHDNPFQ